VPIYKKKRIVVTQNWSKIDANWRILHAHTHCLRKIACKLDAKTHSGRAIFM